MVIVGLEAFSSFTVVGRFKEVFVEDFSSLLRFCHDRLVFNQEESIALSATSSWKKWSHFLPKLSVVLRSCGGVPAEGFHSLKFKPGDFISLFSECLPRGRAWFSFMAFVEEIPVSDFTQDP